MRLDPLHLLGSVGHSVQVPFAPQAGAVTDVHPRSPEQRKKPRLSQVGVQVPVLLAPRKLEDVGYWRLAISLQS